MNINIAMKTPRTTVGMFIIRDGKILMLKRAEGRPESYRFQGYWCIPGGHVDIGETIEQAAIRETREESGLEVENTKFLFCVDEIHPDRDWYAVSHTFFGQASGEVKIQVSEVSDFKWVEISEALTMKLAFNTKEQLERLRDEFGELLRK